jgi:hypothetical protein
MWTDINYVFIMDIYLLSIYMNLLFTNTDAGSDFRVCECG